MSDLDFNQIERDFKAYYRRLPRLVGGWALEFYKTSFQRQGYIDKSYMPWKARNKNAKRNEGRAILTDTGNLKRALRISQIGADYVIIGNSMPYAQATNEGFKGIQNVGPYVRGLMKKEKVGTGTFSIKTRKEGKKTVKKQVGSTMVKGFTRMMNIPARPFMGDSNFLERRIAMRIEDDIYKIFTK